MEIGSCDLRRREPGGAAALVVRHAAQCPVPDDPPGTLAANLVGGYVVGLAIAFFATHPAIPPEWRLVIITGFCGGLTTFSTFSAEVVTLLQQGRSLWALGAAAAHLCGSVVMTVAGIGTINLIRS